MSKKTNRSGDECDRLLRRHADIAKHGAGVLKIMQEKEALQQRRVEFVARYGLSCFKCGTRMNDWARCGKTNGRAWAICVRCIRVKRPAEPVESGHGLRSPLRVSPQSSDVAPRDGPT